jgi:HSP20 family molecular chaperone IbpA
MAVRSESEPAQFVPVVEADIFDRMNETNALIAERAFEIFQERGGGHGSDQQDWLQAEQEILPRLVIEQNATDDAVRLSARVPGFDAKDLEVAVGHLRAVICGVHTGSHRGRKAKKVIGLVELPFAIDPLSATATLQNGTLRVVLPRPRKSFSSS